MPGVSLVTRTDFPKMLPFCLYCFPNALFAMPNIKNTLNNELLLPPSRNITVNKSLVSRLCGSIYALLFNCFLNRKLNSLRCTLTVMAFYVRPQEQYQTMEKTENRAPPFSGRQEKHRP